MERLLIIGLDEPEYLELKQLVKVPIVWHEMLPRLQVVEGQLRVEHGEIFGRFVSVSHVVFHGIFEDDLASLAALALWNGPCFPSPHGMMDCRLRIPCLVRALRVTRFGSMQRGFGDHKVEIRPESKTVAKWGEWHCGENKAVVSDSWICEEPTLLESFIEGEAVRIQLIGDQAWQIHMQGDDWLKSIHHPQSTLVDIDDDLLNDARQLQHHFGLDVIAVDYMVADDGTKHLLEVNHIPSVTAFEQMRTAYLNLVSTWLGDQHLA